MLLETVKIGSKVEISFLEEDTTAPTKYYKTKVENIISPALLTVQTPHAVDRILRVEIGQKLNMYSFQKEGIYLYKVEVESQFLDDNIGMLNLAILSPPKITQRREFFRLECTMDTVVENLTVQAQDAELEDNGGTIKDIGAGGTKLICNMAFDVGDGIRCIFTFRDINFNFTGVIIGKERLEEGLKYRYRYRAKWNKLDQRTEDKLMKCIFETQRASMRKE